MLREVFYNNPYLVGLLSFVLCYLAMPIVFKIAREKNFTVHPNKRSSHTGDIPNIGGLAIGISFLTFFTIFDFKILDEFQFFLLGMLIIFFIGLIDDILVLSPFEKIVGESMAGFSLICLADIRIMDMHGIFELHEIPLMPSYFISFFLLLSIINSINLIDGVDGLASGHGILYCSVFGIYFWYIGDVAWSIIAICLIGSLAVYFIYNVFGKNKIFMGDSGSLFLGFILSALIMHFLNVNANSISSQNRLFFNNAPILCLCVFIFPLGDMARVAIIRMHNHVSPFQPDRNHLHHLLLANQFSHIQVTCYLLCVSVLFILLGILLRNVPMYISLIIVLVAYYVLTSLLVRLSKKRKNA